MTGGLTYVLSCRTKLEKLLCLKYLGRRSRANSGGFHTTKLLFSGPHDTIASVAGSSTMSYVLLRKGGGTFPFNPGFGTDDLSFFAVVAPCPPSTPPLPLLCSIYPRPPWITPPGRKITLKAIRRAHKSSVDEIGG